MSMNSKKPAVFLDRDGVLTKEKGYVTEVDQMELFPYVAECVHQIKGKGFLTIVVTNQSGVARGLFSEDELHKMNSFLLDRTGVEAVYYCPHHPQGVVKRYAKECRCRKPGTGMLDAACKDFSIDREASYMVGDRACDILMGQKAGLKTILLESGYGTARMETAVTPDYICNDLRDVLEILSCHSNG